MARGQQASRAVRAYLDALAEINKPKKRGRQVTVESVEAKLATVRDGMASADPLQKLILASQEITLEQQLEELRNKAEPVDIAPLEAAFIQVAKEYADAKGIVYGAWRAVNVPPKVLREAGIRGPRTATPGGLGRIPPTRRAP